MKRTFRDYKDRKQPKWITQCKSCSKDTYNLDKVCDWCKVSNKDKK